MGYVFAFDLSMNCVGLTIFSNDGYPILTDSIDTRSEKQHQRKLKLIADNMLYLRSHYLCDCIVVEGGFSRYNASTQAIYKVHGITQYLFEDVKQIFYPPSTVKKIVGGKGNMKKDNLREIVESKYNIQFANNDESDSFAVGLCYFIETNIIEWDYNNG